ncbi:MAG: rRNA maturation RNase YbeY [Patescibacteria group bacterium]
MKTKSFVNLYFTDDKEMQGINKKYRGKDYPTDVLSFSYDEEVPDGKFYVGDIVVNLDAAKRQALENSLTLEEEVSKLVAHGMLHLQGVHHEGDDH